MVAAIMKRLSIGLWVLACLPRQPALHYAIPVCEVDTDRNIDLNTSVFGDLHPIRMPHRKAPITRMGVPLYAAMTSVVHPEMFETKIQPKARHFDGVIDLSPAFVVDNMIPNHLCKKLVHDAEQLGFGKNKNGKNKHDMLQILVTPELADALAKKLNPHIDITQVEALSREQKRQPAVYLTMITLCLLG